MGVVCLTSLDFTAKVPSYEQCSLVYNVDMLENSAMHPPILQRCSPAILSMQRHSSLTFLDSIAQARRQHCSKTSRRSVVAAGLGRTKVPRPSPETVEVESQLPLLGDHSFNFANSVHCIQMQDISLQVIGFEKDMAG